MTKNRRKHSLSFKARVALEALEGAEMIPLQLATELDFLFDKRVPSTRNAYFVRQCLNVCALRKEKQPGLNSTPLLL